MGVGVAHGLWKGQCEASVLKPSMLERPLAAWGKVASSLLPVTPGVQHWAPNAEASLFINPLEPSLA